jgi:hypothetical protein
LTQGVLQQWFIAEKRQAAAAAAEQAAEASGKAAAARAQASRPHVNSSKRASQRVAEAARKSAQAEVACAKAAIGVLLKLQLQQRAEAEATAAHNDHEAACMAQLREAAVLVAMKRTAEEYSREENAEMKRYFSRLSDWGIDRLFVQIHEANQAPRVVAFLDAEAIWTVAHLKSKLVVLEGINTRLVYKSEELTDDRTLLSYGIDDDHTIYAIRDPEPRDAAP